MAAVDRFRDKWESISPRERRLVVLLGAAAVIVAVLYVALAIKDRLDALEAKNHAARSALHKLTAYRATARTPAAAGDPVAAITAEQVPLESYIYKASEQAKVPVQTVTPRTPTPRGKYMVHAVQIDVDELSLVQVKDFLQLLETESRIVQVTSLKLNRNFRDQEKLKLSAEISSYSRPAETAGSGSGSGSAKGSAKGSGGG